MNTLSLPIHRHPFRLLAATAALALAAGLAQPSFAQPGPGPGGPGGMPMMGHGMGHGMGPGMMGGQFSERMLDAAKATPEQRTQIRQIVQQAMADLKTQREAGRQIHQDMRALFTQPNIDANAAEALRQKALAQHDLASKRMMQMMLDVSRVLTPEQRQALADRMSQRRAMMERHRAEREALDKGSR